MFMKLVPITHAFSTVDPHKTWGGRIYSVIIIDHANNDTIQIYLAQYSLTETISRYMTVYMVNVAGNCCVEVWCPG